MACRQLTAGKLNERNTLVWMTGAITSLSLWAFPQAVAWIADWLEIAEVFTLVALVSTLILLGLLLQQAVELSLLQVRLREVAQQLAVLQRQTAQSRAELQGGNSQPQTEMAGER